MIILFTGPGGAGKSTFARAWVEGPDRRIDNTNLTVGESVAVADELLAKLLEQYA